MTNDGSSRFSPPSVKNREEPFRSWLGRALLAAGTAVMIFGVLGLFHSAARTHPGEWIRWFMGALIAHDLLLAPIVFAAAALVVNRVPSRFRGPVQGGMLASGVVILVAFPFLRGYGRTPQNPSILPNNYAWGLVLTLIVIWAAAASVLARRSLSHHHEESP